MTLHTKKKTIITAIISALTTGTTAYGDTPISSIGSLGELNVSSGYVIFDTNEGNYFINEVKQSGNARFVTLPENSGGIEHQAFEIPVYDFTTIELAEGVNVFAEGEYALTLLASESANLGANIDLSGIDGEDGGIDAGGGGGGGGGALSIFANSDLNFTGTIDVSGGNGGLSYQEEGNNQGGKGIATGGDGGDGGSAVAGGRGGMGGKGTQIGGNHGGGGGGGGGGGYQGPKGSGQFKGGKKGEDGKPGNCPNTGLGGGGGDGGFSGGSRPNTGGKGGTTKNKDGGDGKKRGQGGGGGAGGDAPSGTNGGIGGVGNANAGGGGGGGGGDRCSNKKGATLGNGGSGGGGGGQKGQSGGGGSIITTLTPQNTLFDTFSFNSGGGGGAGQVFLGTNSGILFYEGTVQTLGGLGQSMGVNGLLTFISSNEENVLISPNSSLNGNELTIETDGVDYYQDLSLSNYIPIGGGGGGGAAGPGITLLAELSKFTVTAKNSKVFITWTTASEHKNAGFRLWRGIENSNNNYETTLLTKSDYLVDFEPNENCTIKIQGQLRIATSDQEYIPAIGNSMENTCYSFTDTNLSNGTYYYLLENIGDDGENIFHCNHIKAVTINQDPTIDDLQSAIDYCKKETGSND